MRGRPSRPVAERFWSYVQRGDECWTWIGARDANGYGRLSLPGRGTIGAHRVSWELHRGEIPDGLCVLHRCDNPPCVWPEHLFLGTHADNVADRIAKGRSRYVTGWRVTHCPRGHAYDASNTRITPTGGRVCRACRREDRRAQRAAFGR